LPWRPPVANPWDNAEEAVGRFDRWHRKGDSRAARDRRSDSDDLAIAHKEKDGKNHVFKFFYHETPSKHQIMQINLRREVVRDASPEPSSGKVARSLLRTACDAVAGRLWPPKSLAKAFGNAGADVRAGFLRDRARH